MGRTIPHPAPPRNKKPQTQNERQNMNAIPYDLCYDINGTLMWKHAATDAVYFLAADRKTGRILYRDPDFDVDKARELVADTIYELDR